MQPLALFIASICVPLESLIIPLTNYYLKLRSRRSENTPNIGPRVNTSEGVPKRVRGVLYSRVVNVLLHNFGGFQTFFELLKLKREINIVLRKQSLCVFKGSI